MAYTRFKVGNFIAIMEQKREIIEVEAINLDEACKKAQDYFENKYGVITHIVVLPVPTRIGVLA